MSASDETLSRSPLIRGLALINDLFVLEQLYGPSVVTELRQTLTETQRAALDAGFLPGGWYDEDIEVRLCRFVGERYGRDAGFVMGVAIGSHVVGRVHRFLARISGPERLLRRTTPLWSYWRNTGQSVVEHAEDGAARVVILNHAPMTDLDHVLAYCGASGYIVAMSGASNVCIGPAVERPERVVIQVTWGPLSAPGAGMFSVDDALATLRPAATRRA